MSALAAIKCAIAEDQTAGVVSSTVRHSAKVNGALDILNGVLAGITAEKLQAAVSQAVTETTTKQPRAEEVRRPSMARS